MNHEFPCLNMSIIWLKEVSQADVWVIQLLLRGKMQETDVWPCKCVGWHEPPATKAVCTHLQLNVLQYEIQGTLPQPLSQLNMLMAGCLHTPFPNLYSIAILHKGTWPTRMSTFAAVIRHKTRMILKDGGGTSKQESVNSDQNAWTDLCCVKYVQFACIYNLALVGVASLSPAIGAVSRPFFI